VDSTVRSFVCCWANATADSANGGYPAEAWARLPENFTTGGRRRVFHGGTEGFAHEAPLKNFLKNRKV
jgi:hypothetical protein